MRPFKEDKSLVYGLCNTNRRKYYGKAPHRRRGSLRRKQCRAIFKNTIWPTASFQPQKRRLRFFWKSLCGNTRSPQPHLGSIYHWKQLQKISETLVSSRFPTNNLKEVEKEVKHYGKVQGEIQEIQEGERCQTMYISF